MHTPLQGVRVVDFGQFIAGPATAKVLADMGADVVKVEPVGGEAARHIGSYGQAMIEIYGGDKRSIAVDLKHPDGLAVAGKLVRSAAIVIQNSRHGAMDSLGLGPAAIRAVNPEVIYASITGFGGQGPSRKRGGFDIAAQAESGIMSVTGEADGEPQRVGFPVVDATAAHAMAEAILGAYIQRLRFGGGQDVEVSLLEAAVHVQGVSWGDYFLTGREPVRKGNGQPSIAPAADVLTTADGAIVISAYLSAHFAKLCVLIDKPALATDPRFATNSGRVANRTELLAELAPAFRAMTSTEAIDLLIPNGIVAGRINSYGDVLANPDVQAAGIFVDRTDDTGTIHRMLRAPWRSSVADPGPRNPAPRAGQHTGELLRELGYHPAEIDDLCRRGVVQVDAQEKEHES